MCKHSDVFSLAVLIGRGLDHVKLLGSIKVSKLHTQYLLLCSVFRVRICTYTANKTVQ